MIDFPIAELLDDSSCLIWLERHLHPDGFACPHGHRPERRLFRLQGDFPAYRCRVCDGYYTLLTDTVFEKTRQRPATLVLLLCGMAKGGPTARLARAVEHVTQAIAHVTPAVQSYLNHTAPAEVMTGTAFEADERYQNAGEKKHAPSRSQ
jgi:hypothetical protein